MTQRLYACYLEARGPAGRRAQWVLFPPRPQLFNGVTTPGRTEAFYWYRVQDREGHRAVWRWAEMTPQMERSLVATVRSYAAREWNPSPLVPVELTLAELSDLIADRKTPYDVLRKATRNARRNLNYEVV